MDGSDHLDGERERMVLRTTGADTIVDTEVIQRLWSGYGQILRCRLDGAERSSVIVKHVRWPDEQRHPRGWSSDRSHERKVASYRVETTWYERYASMCTDACRVPECLALERRDDVLIVLEDLDASGFPGRRTDVTDHELDACISWLAAFHATFMATRPDGLWPTGTYWHLATRPDELDAMGAGALKDAASALDAMLNTSPFHTLVHGDAKLANFCFSADGRRAAAVDFQYVGGGCGMKDLAYFISSCFDEDECEARSPEILDRYFDMLGRRLTQADSGLDIAAIEQDWRALYPVAWADFSRFLQGWSPDHWKLHGFSARMVDDALEIIGRGDIE